MSSKRKRYREYYRSTEAKVPKTTAWRLKKKQKNSFDSATAIMLQDFSKYGGNTLQRTNLESLPSNSTYTRSIRKVVLSESEMDEGSANSGNEDGNKFSEEDGIELEEEDGIELDEEDGNGSDEDGNGLDEEDGNGSDEEDGNGNGSDEEDGNGNGSDEEDGNGNGSDEEGGIELDEEDGNVFSEGDWNKYDEEDEEDENEFNGVTDGSEFDEENELNLLDRDENDLDTEDCSVVHEEKESVMDCSKFSLDGPDLNPLYPGAPISKGASWISIYQYAVSNQLTDSATKELIELINVHCPSSNLCPPSLYILKKHLGNTENVITKCYCSHCKKEVEKECRRKVCKINHAQICYFSILPFESYLGDIFSVYWNEVQYPFTRSAQSNSLKDIQDGEEYVKLTRPGCFLSVPEHAGLILCSDGVPLFKSSGQSLWPIELSISNLPPQIRMNVKYLLLGGIWLGPIKPDMQMILQPIIHKINALNVNIFTPEGTKQLKAKLLLGVFDLPAKATAVNMKQYNGKYGCLYCLDEGLYESHRRIYLPTEAHKPRNIKSMTKWAEQASKKNITIFGIKGPSVLSPTINLVESVPIDYMHAILEGVTKSLFNYWFDSKHHHSIFYLGKKIADVNRALMRIKPPSEIRRTPRSIETSKYWKASEYRAWLLYYSIPILSYIKFPPNYLSHYSLLVTSMHILLSECITEQKLEMARLMLARFYELVPALYPQQICSLNIHSVIHLCDFVQRWGPLWCYSTFGFENLNGYIRKHCHGTKNVLPQLIQAVRMRQTLPILKEKLTQENDKTMEFLGRVCGEHNVSIGLQGKVVNKSLDQSELKALQESGYHVTDFVLPIYPRYKNHKATYSSAKPHNSRNDSICRVITSTHQKFGSILKFCLVNGDPVAIVSLFESTTQDIITIPEHCYQPSLQENDYKSSKLFHIFGFKVKKLSLTNKLIAISPANLAEKCVHIPLKYSPYDIIVTMPNTVEHH